MGPEPGGRGGGQATAEVAARVEDLQAFCDGGERFVPALTGIFDATLRARAATVAAMGAADTPVARVARAGSGGGDDPFAELIAEATINNGFVETIHRSLTSGDGVEHGLRTVPAGRVDGLLVAAGFGQVGNDATLDEDRELAAALDAANGDLDVDEVRANLTDEQRQAVAEYEARLTNSSGSAVPVPFGDIEDPDVRLVVADLIIEQAIVDSRDPNRSQHLPYGHEPWMGVKVLVDEVSGGELQAFVADRLVEEGLALEEEVRYASPQDRVATQQQETATVLVTLGLGQMTAGQRGDLVASFDGDRERARALVEALDLTGDETEGLLEYALSGLVPVGLVDRQQALIRVLETAVDGEGLVRSGGEELFEATIDGREGWHPGFPSPDDAGTSGGQLRVALIAIAGAPNIGLSEVEYQRTLEVDRLLAALPQDATDPNWAELDAALAALGDRQTVDQILTTMMVAELPAAEALRIARSTRPRNLGPNDPRVDFSPTDDRVDLLRLLLGTDAMGNPPQLDVAVAGGLPEQTGGSLIAELRILQALQMRRWNEGRPVEATRPLSDDQLELVADFEAHLGDIDELTQAWWNRGVAPTGGLGFQTAARPTQYQTLVAIAIGELPADDELVDLARRLTDPAAGEVWSILLAAPDNTKFLNPDGSFGGYPADFDLRLLELPGFQVDEDNFTSLTVQLLLHQQLAPTAAGLDGNGDGLITENDRDDWLAANGTDIPPILRDRITFGAGFGLGHDDWGWDELAEGLGILGLAAAVTVSIVYSGGTAAPLWVKAGLVTLAGAEAIAAFNAGDDLSAGLALLGGTADAVSFVRLLANGRRIPTGALLGLADNPKVWDEVTDIERATAYDTIVADARNSDIPSLRALADESADLSPVEFLNRYREIAADNPEAYLAQITDPVRRTIARRELNLILELRLDGVVASQRASVDAAGDAFDLTYTRDQLVDINTKGRALGLTQQEIDDLILVGSRRSKPITADELMTQMENIQVVRDRGYPYRFESRQQFDNFSNELVDGIEDIGLPVDDIRIQGSSLRTPNAQDVDVAVTIGQDQFDDLLVARFSNRAARADGTPIDLSTLNNDQLGALAADIQANPARYNSQARTFAHAVQTGTFNSKGRPGVLPELKAIQRVLAERYPDLNLEAISIQTGDSTFQLEPHLPVGQN